MKAQFFKVMSLVTLLTTLVFSADNPILASQRHASAEQPGEALTLSPANATEATVVDRPGTQVYIVKFADAPLATYDGSLLGLQATNIAKTGDRKLNVSSPASQAYLTYLDNRQETFRQNAESVLDRPVSFIFTYDYVFGGAAMELTAAEAAKMAKLDYVVSITPNFTREIQTDNGPVWIGADNMWTDGYKGENLVVGVVDTGINPLNPSFADLGGDGYNHPNPGVRFGVCDSANPSYDPTFPCNDKLIGAYGLTIAGNPIDINGHGSHTSSTAAGNVVINAEVVAPTLTIARTISGVAPHAHLIMYRACDGTSCDGTALLAGINQAVADGVDAINYSIGSNTPTDPWADQDSLAFLDARAAGVFVATSAGNAGPGFGTVGSPANAPWLTSVGNSSHNRTFINSIIDMTGGNTTPPADIQGKSMTRGYGPALIVYAGDYGDPLCGTPFPAGTWNGEIVVCDRGTYGRVDKGANVLAGGAGGYILANDVSSGDSLVSDPHYLPAVHITYDDGVTLKTWMSTGTGHTATIAGTTMVINDALGDIMAASSSRGANVAVPGVIKPDVSAPGTDIMAAYGVDGAIEWGIISGTSMASPHVAGAGILLMQAHPDWSPAEIQSALMLSGKTNMLKEDATTAADPFDYGGGRIEIGAATDVGFVLDETKAAYLNADPASGGDPSALNIASLSNNACAVKCTWTREIKSTVAMPVEWTTSSADPAFSVQPANFTLPAGGTQTITVTASAVGLPQGDWYFGSISLNTTNPNLTDAHMSVAVVPIAGLLPSLMRIETGRDAGSRLFSNLELSADPLVTDVLGVEPDITEAYLEEDSTNVWPTAPNGMYDDLTQVYTATFEVPVNALYLAVELLETTSPDLDLAIGYDVDGDGQAEETEELANSGSMGALESIFMTAAQLKAAVDALSPGAYASGGTYWVLVMNYAASSPGAADYFKLAIAAVDANDSTAVVYADAPASASTGTPFDLRMYFDLPNFTAWYGIVEYYNNTEFLASNPIQIVRGPDDVNKELLSVDYGTDVITATFAITVASNTSGEDWTYTLTDTLPSGLSFVPGSATGGAVINGNTLTWAVNMPGTRYYAMTTSDTDANCAVPLSSNGTNGAYLDMASVSSIAVDGTTSGDSIFIEYTASGSSSIDYFGVQEDATVFISDDGVIQHGTPTISPWTNYPIPDSATLPNNMMAPLWLDMVIVSDVATNKGLSIGSDNATISIIEIDDAIPYGGNGSEHIDYEVAYYYTVSDAPGNYEIYFAYDNIVGDFSAATVGVENATGTKGTQYGYNPVTLHDELAICFDLVPPEAQSITFQVTAPVPGVYTNLVNSTLTNPGSKLVSNGGDFALTSPTITKTVDALNLPTSGDTVTYTIIATNDAAFAVPSVTMTDALPAGLSFGSWVNTPPSGTTVINDTLSWTGDLAASSSLVWEFTATLDLVDGSGTLTNSVDLAVSGATFTAEADFVKGVGVWLPLVLARSTTK